MTGKTEIPSDDKLEPLKDALTDCTSLKSYIREVQVKISGMEEPLNSRVYEYAGRELEKISGYVGKLEGKISKYVFKETQGDLK